MNWLMLHLDMLKESIGRLAQQPFATLLNVVVFGIALSLPVGFYLVLSNLQQVAGQLAAEPQISVFMALNADPEEVSTVEQRLRRHPEVGRYEFVPRDRALARLKRNSGLGDVLAELRSNPLPDAFVVTARTPRPDVLEQLQTEAAGWPRVEHVQLDSDWARKLDAVLAIGRLAVSLLAVLLSVALVAITFNTIRLQILTRRDEIEVSKLIGATNPFIRRPFLYFGALQGLVGGAAAWLIVAVSVQILNFGLTNLATLYGTNLRLAGLGLIDSIGLLTFAAILGWIGAWLSVSRHLWQIEPK
ncbi:MAG: permease-like cell division protein FtsX [Burkholderiales bacterium]